MPQGPHLGDSMMPTNRAATPTAVTSGQYDGLGRWIPAPVPATGSDSRPPFFRFSSHSGSRPSTTGNRSKFHSGGGDGMAHSSVAPFQGSAGALRGLRQVRAMLMRNTRNDRPRSSEPAVSIWF